VPALDERSLGRCPGRSFGPGPQCIRRMGHGLDHIDGRGNTWPVRTGLLGFPDKRDDVDENHGPLPYWGDPI